MGRRRRSAGHESRQQQRQSNKGRLRHTGDSGGGCAEAVRGGVGGLQGMGAAAGGADQVEGGGGRRKGREGMGERMRN